jgi:hypothetical protein
MLHICDEAKMSAPWRCIVRKPVAAQAAARRNPDHPSNVGQLLRSLLPEHGAATRMKSDQEDRE